MKAQRLIACLHDCNLWIEEALSANFGQVRKKGCRYWNSPTFDTGITIVVFHFGGKVGTVLMIPLKIGQVVLYLYWGVC